MTDALLVSFVTALGYVTAYLRELAFCKYFSIPNQFIELTTPTIIYSTLVLMLYLVIVAHIITAIISTFNFNNVYVKKFFKYFMIWWIFQLNRIAFDPPDKWTNYAILVFILSLLVDDFLLPLRTQKHIKGYTNKISADAVRLANSEHKSPILIERLGSVLCHNYLWLITVPYFAMVFSYGIGRSDAKTQDNFLVTKSVNPTIILKQYGNTFIGLNLDINKVIVNGFHIIDKSNLKDFGPLVLNQVGPITPNTSMKQLRQRY